MQYIGSACFQIDIAKHKPQGKGVEELGQVAVEQAKHQRGGDHRQPFTINIHAVDELLAEDILLNNGGKDDHDQYPQP